MCETERKAADIHAYRHMHCTYTFTTLTAKTLRKLWNNLVVNYKRFFKEEKENLLSFLSDDLQRDVQLPSCASASLGVTLYSRETERVIL